VLSLDSHNAAAMVTLASACLEQGLLSDAEPHVHKALETDPRLASAHVVLGRLHAARGNWPAAIASMQQAHALDPRESEAVQRLAGCHQDTGNLALALQFRRLALQIDPYDPMGHVQLGITLQLSGDLGAAMDSFRRALELDPACGEALSNLGGACIEFGDLVLARSHLEAALTLEPGNLPARSNLLFLLSASPGVEGVEYLNQARQYGAQVPPHGPTSPCVPAPGQPGVDRPLRVGLFSGDLRTHPVGRFLESTLASLNPRLVQLTAYATAAQEDGLTLRLKQHVHDWHQVAALGDDALAELVRGRQLDILVDLSGHTGHGRLPIFARRLAPVQVSWLGYWASTGLPGMDFILADPISAPPGSEGEFSEQVWRLAKTRMCYSPPAHLPPVQASPAPRARNGHVTFGSYQTLAKINDDVLATWRQILLAIPGARLRLQGKFLASPAARSALQARIVASGIGLERVAMLGGCAYDDYLRSYEDVDLVLDTFPFTGGTTTCEALWMGVPTLTLSGQSMVARQGASLMTHAGVPEFVVHTRAQYVQWACAFATAPTDLWKRGAAMRATVQASSVFDGRQFAAQLEAAWLGMWSAGFPERHGNQAGAE
jgi:protein O-GlcNAc transferase